MQTQRRRCTSRCTRCVPAAYANAHPPPTVSTVSTARCTVGAQPGNAGGASSRQGPAQA